MELGDRLAQLRKEKKYTREQFAAILGISKYTLRNYELGVTDPGHPFLIKVAAFFNTSIDYIMGVTGEREKMGSYNLKISEYEHIKKYRNLDNHGKEHINTVLDWETERIASSNYRKQLSAIESAYPLTKDVHLVRYCYGGVSAGDGIYMLGSEESEEIEIPANELNNRADYVVRVNGESMKPAYNDGDKVLVAQKETVDIGDIGIFVKNGEAFIKKRGRYELISLNTDYPNIEIKDSDNIVCIGKVIGKLE